MKTLLLLLLPTLGWGLPSTPILDLSPPTTTTTPTTNNTLSLPDAVSQFTSDIFREVESTQGKTDNLVISPLSIYLALSLLYQGVGDTNSTTYTQLGELLRVNSASDAGNQARDLLAQYTVMENNGSSVNTSLPSDLQILLASAVFSDSARLTVKKKFKNVAKKKYSAQVEEVNYSQGQETAAYINQWIQERTNNLIQEAITEDSIHPDTGLLLLNAVYFKASWEVPFISHLTRKQNFFLPGGHTIRPDTMLLDDTVLVGDSSVLDCQVVSLKYSTPGFTLLLLLPNDQDNLNLTASTFGSANFRDLHNNCSEQDVLLTLPKFTISSSNNLVKPLKKLGVEAVFSEQQADLRKISNTPTRVSDIFHQVKIVINEEGSEAAAVTGIILDTRSSGGSRKKLIRFNRPFYFVIYDIVRDVPLFLGMIFNPSEEVEELKTEKESENPINNRVSETLVKPNTEDDSDSGESETEDTEDEDCWDEENERFKGEVKDGNKVHFPCSDHDRLETSSPSPEIQQVLDEDIFND